MALPGDPGAIMTVMMLSAWEMRTHGQAALRVLGVPFGASERAVEMVVWAHAVQAGAVEFLIDQQEQIRERAGRSFDVLHEDDCVADLDGNGQTIFTAGPAAIDLATALASRHGTSVVTVSNVFGGAFSAGLAHRGMTRGFGCKVTGPEGGWFAHPSSGLTEIAQTNTTLNIHCSRQAESIDDEMASGERIEVDTLLSLAERDGYRTDVSAGEAFLDLGHRLWLPTSERSRAQGSGGDKSLSDSEGSTNE